VIIILILFGGSRLAKIGKGVGQAIGNFKKAFSETKGVNNTKNKEKSKENRDR